jgi:hemoglobin
VQLSAALTGAVVSGGHTCTVTSADFLTRIGGEATLRELVTRFYAGVATDPLLRPMYPESDLGPAAERLSLFLIQYWGGPSTYSQLRGHPRLRLRHAPFVIASAQHDAWLRHMREALDALALAEADDAQLWAYLSMAADSLRNSPD